MCCEPLTRKQVNVSCCEWLVDATVCVQFAPSGCTTVVFSRGTIARLSRFSRLTRHAWLQLVQYSFEEGHKMRTTRSASARRLVVAAASLALASWQMPSALAVNPDVRITLEVPPMGSVGDVVGHVTGLPGDPRGYKVRTLCTVLVLRPRVSCPCPVALLALLTQHSLAMHT